MPVEFADLLTQNDFYFLSGLSGIVSALVILKLWANGL